MNLDQFLEVAAELDKSATSKGFNQAYARSAINRYDYGAAWAIDSATAALGLEHGPGEWSHAGLGPALRAKGHYEAADAFERLRDARNDADYKPGVKVNAERLAEARDAAARIVAYIRSPPRRPRRR